MKKKSTPLWLALPSLLAIACPLWSGAPPHAPSSPNLTGAWRLAWEARIGTESGALKLRQAGDKLVGTFDGRQGSLPVTGTCEHGDVSFALQFEGSHPYTLSFKGHQTGGKLSGVFEVLNVRGGYDWHGENARTTNYSWTATRLVKRQVASGPH